MTKVRRRKKQPLNQANPNASRDNEALVEEQLGVSVMPEEKEQGSKFMIVVGVIFVLVAMLFLILEFTRA